MDDTIQYESDTDGYNALGPTERRDLAGDHSDDDGVIIDDAFIAATDGANVSDDDLDDFGTAVENYDWTSQGPKPTTRIISGTIPLVAGAVAPALGTPIQVLPADPKRIWLRFRTTFGSPDVRWSDELTTCYGSGQMADTDQPVEIPHTGALWVLPLSDDSSNYLHYWAVISND